ncbi:hypothetical protein XCM_9995 [Xanthomonas citri pv. mangiferaeindicae]|nr:hypothetical protein XCM_9995 [Xanthomonas citri pv. mangiferaeindicae]
MVATGAAEHVLWVALARRKGGVERGVGHTHQVLAADGTVAATEAILLAVFAGHRDIAAAACEIGAGRKAGK